jgi:hypothetical protein
LCGLHSILLLAVKHLVALDVAQVAHVAYISESVVVVEAPLAGPITHSFLVLLFVLCTRILAALCLSSWLESFGLELGCLILVGKWI